MSIGSFPEVFESRNLSGDNLSREIGRMLGLLPIAVCTGGCEYIANEAMIR